MTYLWKWFLQAAYWVAALVMGWVFNSTSQARLTCGSDVLRCWPEPPDPICSQPMMHSCIHFHVTDRTFNGLWKAVIKSIASCMMVYMRFLPRCARERGPECEAHSLRAARLVGIALDDAVKSMSFSFSTSETAV